jgi:hypothetical protein
MILEVTLEYSYAHKKDCLTFDIFSVIVCKFAKKFSHNVQSTHIAFHMSLNELRVFEGVMFKKFEV